MNPAKVLVIDDEHMIRWSIEQTLRGVGCEVQMAETAAQGIAACGAFQPDIVFLDVRLPDEDGRSVLRRIKQDRGSKTAVIVMTAFGDDHAAAQVMELGAYAYLKKPFDFDRLPATVAAAIGQA